MEAASVPGAPAAAEPVQPVTPTEPVAPATGETAATTQAATQDDVPVQLQRLQSRLDALEGGGEAQAPAGLGAALAGEPQQAQNLGDLFTPEELAAIQSGDLSAFGQHEPVGDPQQQLAELDSYVAERVQQGIDAAVTPLVQERQDEQLAAIESKYPDIMEPKVFSALEGHLNYLVQRYGNEALKLDPKAVEMAYKAVKAEMADADEVPAEQAATNGASLETNAGQTQVGDSSPESQYTKSLLGASSGGDAFT